MKATRKDVARLAGVSNATVSNVINNSRVVKNETAIRVRAVIEKLNYQPDFVARSLTTNRTMQVGIVLHDVKNPLFGEIVSEFEKAASKKNYFVSICTSHQRVDEYFDDFISRRIDGVYVTALPYMFHMPKLHSLINHGIHVVTSGYFGVDNAEISSLDHDFYSAMNEAVDYLFSLGHRNIGYISGLGRDLEFDTRCDAYLKTLVMHNIGTGDSLLIDGHTPYSTNIEAGYLQTKVLIESGKKFTAVICGNDLMAMGSIKAFIDSGIQVPQQVSVMGFDGIDIVKYTSPSITTMAMNKPLIGGTAFDLLYQKMVHNKTSSYVSHLTLQIGGSTGVIAEH